MSGLDEQFKDIPMCPVCEETPAFWILTDGTEESIDMANSWVWYFRDNYRPDWARRGSNAVQLKSVDEEFLHNGIRAATCRPDEIIYYDDMEHQHTFRAGEETFDLIMQHLRAEVRRSGFHVGN